MFSNAQRALVDGAESVEVEARRVVDLIEALYARYPKLAGQLDHAAVAIDGNIHNEGRYQQLEPTSEVHYMGQLSGGR